MDLEICQIIYMDALKNLLQGYYDEPAPDDIQKEHIKTLVKIQGHEALIRHPDEIQWIFRDMDMKLYQEVQELYCSKYLRKPLTVTEIINRQRAIRAQAPIAYHIIWIVCTYLWQLRKRVIEAQTVFDKTGWFLGYVDLNIRVYVDESPAAATLIGVVDDYDGSFLAFRVIERRNMPAGMRLALYDALMHCRQPNPGSPDGLIWKLPASVALQQPGDPLCTQILNDLGIQSQTTEAQELSAMIKDGWSRDLIGRRLSSNQIERAFGTYLNNLHKGNPRKRFQKIDKKYRASIGYKNDPALMLPILRELLPLHPAQVDPNGEVCFGSTVFASDLLQLWSGEAVQIRLSEKSNKVAWVYSIDGCFLCEATAKRPGRDQGNKPNQ
ncbi:MAG TPA: hypothetical protein VEA58_14120 [Anaerovoracaceae bacterium]|nr:hypothetical protein [Anaerovoracaceae bacterium]